LRLQAMAKPMPKRAIQPQVISSAVVMASATA
jgi:hypothetical protein